jgi:methionyl aminopeptidase
MDFPKSICISTNDIVTHGVPNEYEFKDGDIANLDLTIFKDGFFGDNSLMVWRGEIDSKTKKLIATVEKATFEAIEVCKVGRKISEIGKTIE